MAGVIFSPTFTSVTTAVNTNPVSGDMRKNYQTNETEIYNGSGWVVITDGLERKETLADSILHAQDTIESYIEEDHKDNVAIQDAYSEWLTACEKFRVIASIASTK